MLHTTLGHSLQIKRLDNVSSYKKYVLSGLKRIWKLLYSHKPTDIWELGSLKEVTNLDGVVHPLQYSSLECTTLPLKSRYLGLVALEGEPQMPETCQFLWSTNVVQVCAAARADSDGGCSVLCGMASRACLYLTQTEHLPRFRHQVETLWGADSRFVINTSWYVSVRTQLLLKIDKDTCDQRRLVTIFAESAVSILH